MLSTNYLDMEKKIEILRQLLEEKLLPLITSDYVFLDLPYHPNVGDTLIAYAAKRFLLNTPYHCLYWSSGYSFDNRTISPNTLIIFNGGGNFGDLWKNFSIFRNKIIKEHPYNRFLILPQSVCYCDKKNLIEDVEVYSKCGARITICARDKESYNFLKSNFLRNNVLLVPDMAFYTDTKLLKSKAGSGRALFLRRRDAEYVSNDKYDIVPDYAEIHDWPTMERFIRIHWKYLRLIELRRGWTWYPNLFLHIEDVIWQKIILPYYLRNGINFVNRYDVIYTTRLHVAILGVLLKKKVFFFDNSYGKNSALYKTWLHGLPNIKLIN